MLAPEPIAPLVQVPPPLPGEQAELSAIAEKAQREMEKREAWLMSPEAVQARRASRVEHRGLSASSSLALARRSFPTVAQPAWEPPKLAPGDVITGYEGDHVMRVDRAGPGGRVLVDSSVPLWTPNSSGRSERVSVTLQDRGANLVPENPLAKTSIAKDPRRGIEFSGRGFTVVPSGVSSSSPQLVGGKAYFANAYRDTDWVVAPLPDGAETFWQVRSPESPEAFTLSIDGAAGARLRVVADDPRSVELVDDNDKRLALIAAPTASDAQGQPVDVAYEIQGLSLVVSVAHRGGDFAYPILVDPVIDSDSQPLPSGWFCGTFYPSAYWCGFGGGPYGWGQYMTRSGSAFSPANAYAHWSYIAPAQSFITAFVLQNVNIGVGEHICWIAGIKYAGDVAWQGTPAQVCNSTYLNASLGFAGLRTSYNNFARVQIFNPTANSCCGAMVHSGYQEVWLEDDSTPTVDAFSVSPAPTGGWMNIASVSGGATVNDPGVGVNSIVATGATGTHQAQYYQPQNLSRGCAGTAGSRCAGAWQRNFTLAMPEGDTSIALVKGIDAAGRESAPATTQVYKVDRTAPKIDAKGRLAAAQNRAVSSRMRLELAGDDTDPGHATSGTVSVSLKVGNNVTSKTESAQRIQMDPYDFDPTTRPMGPVPFHIETQDVAGNTGTLDFNVTVARGQLTTLMEGQRTAKRMVLQAKDLRPTDAPPTTHVHFQYRRGLTATDTWQDIPAQTLRTTDNQTVSDINLTMAMTPDGRLSPKVVWDVASTIGATTDKPVYVRGYFGDEPGNVTEDVYTRVDPSGVDTDDAQADVGPGKVDLLTGNFALSSPDVSIDSFKSDLSVTRGYNSRKLTDGPLGRGWTLGTSVLASGAAFQHVTDYAEQTEDAEDDSYGIAALTAQDGGELIFEEHETDHGYYPEPGMEALQLVRLVKSDGTTEGFKLTMKGSGDVLLFDWRSARGIYELTSVKQQTSGTETTFEYEPVPGSPGQLRIKRMLAPGGAGINCSEDRPATTTGCRSLRFEWGNGATAPTNRLYQILFTAPGAGLTSGGSAVSEVAAAQYAYDSAGRLTQAWDPRISPALKTTYAYSGTTDLLAEVKPPGENAWRPEYQATDGPESGRLRRVSRTTPQGAPGTPDVDAVETIRFEVPLWGSGAPYDMSPGQLANWSQDDLPTDAAAVFRPGDTPGDPVNYDKATIHYVNGFGRLVNLATPGGAIATTEYDAAGNTTRELTATNRKRALDTGSTTAEHAARAEELDIDRSYGEESTGTGWRLLDEYGPLHAVRLADGSTVNAREHKHIEYDQAKPAGDTTIYNLPTTTTVSARFGGIDRDSRLTTTTYGTTSDQWKLRLPQVTTVDPAGLNLRTTNVYDANGLVLKQRLPRSPNSDAPSTRETVYYTAAAHPNPDDAGCGNKPEWVNLPCKVRTAVAAAPALPTSVLEYNAYGQVTKREDRVAGTLRRTTTIVYDAAARRTSEQIVGSGSGVGTDPARKTYAYETATGRPVGASTPDTTPARTTSTTYDAVGRPSTYTDADGAVTTTRYDLLGRPIRVSDTGGGDRTVTYDATTARIDEVDDTTLGRITAAEYDLDGRITRQTFQTAGLDLIERYDESGDIVRRTYRKTTNCASMCDWLDWQAVASIHGQWLSQTGTDGTRGYAYDTAGRVTETQDRPTGTACSTRKYQYDADSNRTELRTFPAASDGACSTTTTPTTQAFSYDEADRVTGSGIQYDDLGRIRSVPADAAGGSTLSAEFYTDDLVQSLQQAGRTTTMARDPFDRVRTRTTSPESAVVSHYGDASDEPVWTEQGSIITRYFNDLVGDLAAVQDSSAGITLQLSDLHGDVVAEIPNNASAPRPAAFLGTDEFGVPRGGPAGESIAKVGTSVKALTTAATTVPIAKPAGTASGDLVYAQITAVNNANITPPSGWIAIDGGEMISYNTRYQTFYKIAGASEPATYNFGLDQSRKHIGAITVLRNVSQEHPIDAVAADYDNSVDLTAPAVTPSVDNTAQLVFAGRSSGDLNGGSVLSFASPLTEEWEATTGTASGDRSAAGALRLLSGGAGVSTGTTLVTNDTGYGIKFGATITAAIRPASSGPVRSQINYGYLGAKQRNSTLPRGAVEMGVRVYVPQLGRFLQPDLVYGGSCNAYDYTCQNPLNNSDLTGMVCDKPGCQPGPKLATCAIGNRGRCSKGGGWGVHVPVRTFVKQVTKLTRTSWRGLKAGTKDFIKTEAEFWSSRYREVRDASNQELKDLASALCQIFSLRNEVGPSCDLGDAYNRQR